jgi:hypothetical protein
MEAHESMEEGISENWVDFSSVQDVPRGGGQAVRLFGLVQLELGVHLVADLRRQVQKLARQRPRQHVAEERPLALPRAATVVHIVGDGLVHPPPLPLRRRRLGHAPVLARITTHPHKSPLHHSGTGSIAKPGQSLER